MSLSLSLSLCVYVPLFLYSSSYNYLYNNYIYYYYSRLLSRSKFYTDLLIWRWVAPVRMDYKILVSFNCLFHLKTSHSHSRWLSAYLLYLFHSHSHPLSLALFPSVALTLLPLLSHILSHSLLHSHPYLLSCSLSFLPSLSHSYLLPLKLSINRWCTIPSPVRAS